MKTPTSRSSLRGGLLAKLGFFLVIVLVILAVVWAFFLPPIVTNAIYRRTQFDASLSKLTINPFTGRVRIVGLVLRNPANFTTADFVQVRELRMDVDLGSLFTDRLVLEDGEINIAKLALVRNAEGQSNVQLFQQRLLGEKSATTEEPTEAQPSDGKSKAFLIRHLDLRFDQIILSDAGMANPRTIDLNLQHTYENVTTTTELAVPVVSQLATRSGFLNRLIDKLRPKSHDKK